MNSIKVIEIAPSKTLDLLQEGALLVDVREWSEVNQVAFDVSNLMVIPLSEFEERYKEIPKDRNIIVGCRSGQRSLRATYYLMNCGYEKVMNMQGGINEWIQQGLPVKIQNFTMTFQSAAGCCGSNTETNTSCCDTSDDASSCCSPSSGGGSCCG